MGDRAISTITSYRDLRAWKSGMSLVELVYGLTQVFPKSEIYGLASQMRRAAVSIPSNIAEWHTREHTKEYLQYVAMAQGSLAELQTQYEIAVRLNHLAEPNTDEFSVQATALAKQLYSLRNALSVRMRDKVSRVVSQPPTPNPHPQEGI